MLVALLTLLVVSQESSRDTLVIRDVAVIDVARGNIVPHPSVLISGSRIERDSLRFKLFRRRRFHRRA